MGELGDAGEAQRERAHLFLWHPLGQQPTEVGRRQHAVGKHIGHAGLACKVDINVDRIVVTRRTAIESQGGAVDGRQVQRGQCIANLDIAVQNVHELLYLNVERGCRGHRRCGRHPDWSRGFR
ncbi:hypothetical protein D3C85_1450870 [compost metagenome]